MTTRSGSRGPELDVRTHNRDAWNESVEQGNQWTVPSSPEIIQAARRGQWQIFLTNTVPVPRDWFPELSTSDVLCLACGGGQQGPILAAAGARGVTVFDNSSRQLEGDRSVAERESLEIETIEGDMRDLSVFGDESFDLIVHPISNVFCPEVRPVWREAFRVIRPGGVLMAGLMNPSMYVFDQDREEAGVLEVKHRLPYSDAQSLTEEQVERYRTEGRPLEFSHSLTDLIGGQLDAGFLLTSLYEDRFDPHERVLSQYMPTMIATRAAKP
ncbi:MAG: class I SAM-dependent methyltransferase [Candidatus Bipolaricaulia bacterium]